MFAPDPEEKFDFQNMDVKLYLALRSLLPMAEQMADKLGFDSRQDEFVVAKHVMREFTTSFGPVPDWAVERNFSYALVAGAQLMTKDGRRMGNAHIVSTESIVIPERADRNNPYGDVLVYHCLTDAGSKFTMQETEILGQFHIGDWISEPARILRDFDRSGAFVEEPK